MKKILVGAVMMAAGVALASSDSTIVGALAVPSSEKETIVAVPWLASSNETSSVKVTDLFVKEDLSDGDELLYYTGSGYTCWKLSSGSWVPANNVTAGGAEQSAGEAEATLNRGQAIILRRTTIKQDYFRIIGRPYTGTETAVSLPAGSSSSPVYSLVAPPSSSGSSVDVNTGITWSGVTKYDGLILPDGTSLVWSKSGKKWFKSVDNTWTSDNITIAEGNGAWFISKSEGTKSFTLK